MKKPYTLQIARKALSVGMFLFGVACILSGLTWQVTSHPKALLLEILLNGIFVLVGAALVYLSLPARK